MSDLRADQKQNVLFLSQNYSTNIKVEKCINTNVAL